MNIKPGFIIAVVSLFFLLSLIAMCCEQLQPSAYFAAHTKDGLTHLEIVTKLMTFDWNPLTIPDVVNTFLQMLFFDYSFFTGAWVWVRYILFLPFGLAVAFLLIIGILLAAAQVVGKIFGWFGGAH